MINTVKTTFGYLVTLLSKHTPLKLERNSLKGIYNHLPVSSQLTTSGQPTEKQFQLIQRAGFTTVINLAPHNAENAITNEQETLKALGLKYIHIPVNFQKPSEREFSLFVQAMKATKAEKVWLHCAANMRVSAFLYRYRCEELNQSKESAKQDLEKIWEPIGVWKTFITAGPAKPIENAQLE